MTNPVKCRTCYGRGRVVAMIHTKLESFLDFILCPVCNGRG